MVRRRLASRRGVVTRTGVKNVNPLAAYAAFEENVRGTIVVGKLADLTVLSADIMKIPEMDILKTHCLMTVIGGEIVYQAAPGTAVLETDFTLLPATELWWASGADDE